MGYIFDNTPQKGAKIVKILTVKEVKEVKNRIKLRTLSAQEIKSYASSARKTLSW